MPRQGALLLDTGVLVALLHADDGRHEAAKRWLAGCNAKLHTVDPVLGETAFFLPARQRATVAELAAKGTIEIHRPDATAYKRIGTILSKYADLDPDWADAMLVWAAEETGIHSIATFDVRDFSTYRIHGRSKFLLESIA
jgi:predicted nucleic acid-binding protein